MSYDIVRGLIINHLGLAAVKIAAVDGTIDAILVTDIARIGRYMENVMVFQEELKQHGVSIIALDIAECAA